VALKLHKLNVFVAVFVTTKHRLILFAALVSSILMSVKNGSNFIYFDGFELVKVSMSKFCLCEVFCFIQTSIFSWRPAWCHCLYIQST